VRERPRGQLSSRRLRVPQYATIDDEWRAYLTGVHPELRRGRRVFRFLPSPPRCKLCFAPFRAPGSLVLRRLGYQPWEKNPNLCRRCLEKLSRKELGGAEVELSLLFADVRGSTPLAERMGPSEFARLLNRFYATATEILIRTDALVDKVGDEVVGLYLPGIAGPKHPCKAVQAAEELLRETGHGASDGPWIPLGVGVHSGTAFVGAARTRGEVIDFTALGEAVNLAARLSSAAAAGEILLSDAVVAANCRDSGRLEHRDLTLKGISKPVGVAVLRSS
jgi:adenylate cyclase